MTILTWIIATILGLFFPFVGIVKIFGVPKKAFKEQKKLYFDNYGIDRKGIRSIGLAEVLAGSSVWFWASSYAFVAQVGTAALILITIGATFFHLVYDEKPAPQAAIVMLVLSGAFYTLITFY